MYITCRLTIGFRRLRTRMQLNSQPVYDDMLLTLVNFIAAAQSAETGQPTPTETVNRQIRSNGLVYTSLRYYTPAMLTPNVKVSLISFCHTNNWASHRAIRRFDEPQVQQLANSFLNLWFENIWDPVCTHSTWTKFRGLFQCNAQYRYITQVGC